MMFRRSYQLSERTLAELKVAGVRPQVLSSLQAKARGAVFRGDSFQRVLADLTPSPTPEEVDAIRRYGQRSTLRLEPLIPYRGLREWVEALIVAGAIALLVRSFLFAPFKIPSSSMVPTIQVGDHIFATMYSYGLAIPFTDIKLFSQPVKRGDIIIFPYPKDPSVDYIKRVIGVGGDTIEVQGKTVLVNGKALDEPYAYYDPGRENIFGVRCEGLSFCGPLTVPPGHLFMMGDNRLDSADSRVWGFVDENTVKGRGRIIYWSHDPRDPLFSFDDFHLSLPGYRLERLGKLLR